MVAYSLTFNPCAIWSTFTFCGIVGSCAVYLSHFLMTLTKHTYLRKPYTDLYLAALGFGLLSVIFDQSLLLIGSAVALAACLHPVFAGTAAELWKKVAQVLGFINSSILLTILFIIFITPLAFFYRISRAKKAGDTSTWKMPERSGTDFSKPW